MNKSPFMESETIQTKRQPIAETAKIQRRLVLKYGPISSSYSYKIWKTPPKKMKFIVSSTFTDTAREREIVMNEASRMLRPLAAVYGIEIIVVDMRWGVRDENTLDHRTWIECSRIIEMCREESCGTFFISLQAEKYGYTPLPKTLDKQKFDERLSSHSSTNEDIFLAREWYILDENALPPVYVLQSLSALNDEYYWKTVAPALLKILDGLPFDENLCHDLLVNRSVTEYEVKSAICREHGDASRIFWFNREFKDGLSDELAPKIRDYCDYLDDPSKRQRYEELKRWMLSNIPEEQRRVYNNATFEAYVSEDSMWKDQFSQWKDDVFRYLKSSLDDIIETRRDWKQNACGLNEHVSGDEIAEMLHHSKWAAEKLHDFVGRGELVEAVLAHVFGESSQTTSRPPFTGMSVAVIGVSGAGKTALMAYVAGQVYSRQAASEVEEVRSRPVISRFCGTSAASYSGLSLVRSLCRQIHLALDHDMSQSAHLLSTSYAEAVEHLSLLLRENAVVLCIDSLDQLLDDDLARSKVSFLRDLTPHVHTRIIVSALPDEKDAATGQWKYIYGCDSRLAEACVPRVVVPPLATANSGADLSEAKAILSHLLSLKKRRLTPDQWDYCLRQASGEPIALYLSLAVRVISTWTSTASVQSLVLPNSVSGLISQIFSTVERDYGQALTRAALGFVTFSLGGVTDTEMCDMLSMHEDVLRHVGQYSKTDFIPAHVWLRLRAELYGLLTEKGGGCLGWYHRQLREVAAQRYSEAERAELFTIMARYFSDLVPEEVARKADINPQPLLLGTSFAKELLLPNCGYLVNARRCLEAGEHLLNAGLLEDARNELCEPLGVLARLECGEGFALVRQLGRLAGLLPQDERVDHYLRWVRRDCTQLAAFPSSMIASCLAQPKTSQARHDLIEIMEDVFYKPSKFYRDTAARCVTLGLESSFDPLESILQGHRDAVSSVCCSRDGLYIASSSGDRSVRIWELRSGAVVNELQGHTEYVNSVCISPDGSRVASGAGDAIIRICEIFTGVLLQELPGHAASVNWVSFSPTDNVVASASSDSTVRLWDLEGTSVPPISRTLRGHKSAVNTLCYSADGLKIASGSKDGLVCIWNVATAEMTSELMGHTDAIRCLSFNPSGNRVASSSWDRTIRVWLVTEGVGSVARVLEGHTDSVYCVSFSPDGSKLVSGSGSGDRTIRFWDAESGAQLRELLGHTNYVTGVCFSPDGKKIISSSGDRTIRIWGAESYAAVPERQGHRKYVTSVSFLSGGRRLVSGSGDGTVCIWDRDSGDVEHTLRGHSKFVYSVSASPDGSRIASGSGDCSVRVWDSTSGSLLTEVEGHSDYVYSVSFSPDGAKVLSASVDRSLRISDSSTGAAALVIPAAHSGAIYCSCFSPDGLRLASGSSDCAASIWNIATGEKEGTFRGHGASVYSLCFSGDSKRVVSASGDRLVMVWDAASTESLLTLSGHSLSVRSVCFSSDGCRIVSGSFDRSICVWDAKTGDLLNELLGHTKYVSSVSFSSDGREVVSGSGDRSVRVWNALRRSHDVAGLRRLGSPTQFAKSSRTVGSVEALPSAAVSTPLFAVGDKVEAQFENGDEFFAAYVVSVADNGSYSVLYDDGDKEDNLSSHRVRRPG